MITGNFNIFLFISGWVELSPNGFDASLADSYGYLVFSIIILTNPTVYANTNDNMSFIGQNISYLILCRFIKMFGVSFSIAKITSRK